MIDSKIQKLIRANTDIPKVIQGQMPDNEPKPCITWELYLCNPGLVYGGAGGLTKTSLQIDVWYENGEMLAARETVERLVDAIHGYTECVTNPDTGKKYVGEIQLISCDNKFVGKQEDVELLHGVLQFTIQHKTPKTIRG